MKDWQSYQLRIKGAKTRQAKTKVQKAKWKNVEHAREKEKIGATAGNESCTSMIRTPLSQ